MKLSLEDDFTPGMARAAAATALLNRELNSLSGSSVKADRSSQMFVRDLQTISREANGTGASINQLTGRIRVLGEVAAVLGPALVPLGGVAVAGVAGLANQMGVAAIAGGVLIGSLQGLGDALGAMNKAQLDPTNKNLEAAEDALKRLAPAAREFAEAAFDLKPALAAIRDMGAESLMPGFTESLDNLERLGPKVAGIFQAVAGAMGDIAADSSASLASERWEGFFEFVQREAPDAITELATTVGSLTHGMAELWQAFTPVNDGFSSWLMGVADGFDQWATGLSATEGFAEFVDYIRTTGPQVADTLGALANAVLQIVEASAPLGGPVLAALEATAKVVAAIADSDLGTPIMAGVAALSLLNRSLAVTASLSKASLSTGLFAGLGTAAEGAKKGSGSIRALGGDLALLGRNFATAGTASERMAAQNSKALGNLKETGAVAGKAAGALGGLALISSGAADGLGLTNTASLALMGSLGGAPGIAIGAAAGALLDLSNAGSGARTAIEGLAATAQSGNIEALGEQIARAKNELAAMSDHKWVDFGDGLAWVTGKIGDGEEKIRAAEQALEDLSQAEGIANAQARGAALAFLQQTGANVNLGKWSSRSTEAIKAQADAIMATREEANKTARSFVGLGDSLNDGKVSLGQWIKDMASTADALNNFTTNSQRAAKRGLEDGLIRQLQAMGPEGALRMRQLANATEEEIARANAAFLRGERAIERYNNYKVPPKKIEADARPAFATFRAVDVYLDSLDGKTATTHVNTVYTVTGPQGAAIFGGAGKPTKVKPEAYGDYKDRHNPEIAPGGAWRVWAEPETQGESYIPHANDDRRPRAKQILEHTADKFGGQVLWFAKGGSTDGKKPRKPETGLVEDTETEKERERREERERKAEDRAEQYYSEQERAQREAEQRAEHESKMFLAVIEGQERAAQGLLEAAGAHKAAAESVRDGWAQAMDRAGSAATAGFQSDLFGSQQHGMWSGKGGGTGSSWRDALSGDIAGLQERGSLVQMLSGQGIKGSALEALLAQGSNDQVRQLIESGEAGQFAAMYAQREALTASTGQMVGQAAYGAEFAASEAAVLTLSNTVLALQAELAAISAQRPITVYEAYSAQATAAEIARLQAIYGAGG
ncbi:hypothetical protein [Nocardioides sp.]|uniref:hypothetical protein n=1 Tax=Nocardioides sp. TaxID=35761 RepID=UPI002626439C|nr:hypothetical protein [Nocardioides sp.]